MSEEDAPASPNTPLGGRLGRSSRMSVTNRQMNPARPWTVEMVGLRTPSSRPSDRRTIYCQDNNPSNDILLR
eukprot:9047347-Pyramimonas_sp.AAC.1